VVQPSPAPRFSRTPGALERPPAEPGADTDQVLAELGFGADEITKLRETGAVA
jgi:alpha-methylacyl-CoA racemase